jgi:PilZ domain
MGDFPRVVQIERRQQPRLKTALGGRYMLANLREHLCTVMDASSAGLVLAGPEQGKVGETVIVYIDQMGRIEGQIVRQVEGGFALKFRGPPSRVTEALVRLIEQRRSAN